MKEIDSSAVTDRDSFISFIELLVNDLKENPEDWQNRELDTFLFGLASWINNMDGYYANTGMEAPKNINWRFLADTLLAAGVYE
jgi:hypothetical protein